VDCGSFATTAFHNDSGKIHRDPKNGVPGIYTFEGFGDGECEIINYEDSLAEIDVVDPIIILRDPFNCFASRLMSRFGLENKLNINLWKNHAYAVLDKHKHILYNEWFVSKIYREGISSDLGMPHIDAFLDELSTFGFGSSFDIHKFTDSATKMDVLKRWKNCLDNESYLKLIEDKELIELSSAIFGNGILKMYQELIQFALDHPETIDDVNVIMNKKALPYLLDSDLWPRAATPSLIVDQEDEEQRHIRAKAIMTRYIKEDFTNKKFLDFGAGDSDCIKFATGAKVAMAYDIVKHDGVTIKWQEVIDHRPYDIILLYDVIDHLLRNGQIIHLDDVADTIADMVDVLGDNGVIYMRCHPWTSRHGTHAYKSKSKNKAFIHYYTEEFEIPTIRIIEPILAYETIFKKAGLKIIERNVIKQPLEPIFGNPAFGYWKNHFTLRNIGMYQEIMSINFIDYKLAKL